MDDFSVQQAWIVHDRDEPLPTAFVAAIAMRRSQAGRTCLTGASASAIDDCEQYSEWKRSHTLGEILLNCRTVLRLLSIRSLLCLRSQPTSSSNTRSAARSLSAASLGP